MSMDRKDTYHYYYLPFNNCDNCDIYTVNRKLSLVVLLASTNASSTHNEWVNKYLTVKTTTD